MLIDYHLHTKRCKHAAGEIHEYVERAIELNLPEIAFTDHIPLPNHFDSAHRMADSELESYLNDIENVKTAYPEIKIKSGIEADYYEGFEDYLNKIFSRFNFDLIIMSVHFIKGWTKNNWVFSYYFPDRSITEIYSDYLQAVKKGIETGLFDVVGHLDLIKSNGASVLDYNKAELETIMRAIKKQKMAIELNTSGLRREIQEIYPALTMLPLIIENEIAITVGSDAHQPNQVGFHFSELERELCKSQDLIKLEQGSFSFYQIK